ncbi:TetR family transcriptional regulator [Gordonia phthalatica]|uniref:Transcriptional regulator n=1 Tax=Gordonia phthalatica TaxID=1136941 RepID=A0A0N9NHN2_9ACTN|nr:TetR family transcriptional regulator [Gordonia phthalatica]ALG85307.1 transcriptional regulator [Gordonia phthalatica]
MNSGGGRGRRPGGPDTRGQILDSARRHFLADGYRSVTMRQIAADADVDLALLSYYFGSKKGLFSAAVTASANPAEVIARALDGDPAQLPQRVLRDLLILWDDPVTGAPLKTMLANLSQDAAFADLIRQMLERELIARLADRLSGVDARRRAAAFCTQIAGIVVTRYLLRLEPVASMPADELVSLFVPALRDSLQPTPRRPPTRGR